MSETNGRNGARADHLGSLPALISSERLRQAWQQLEQASDELEQKDHTIARLYEDLRKARQGLTPDKAPPIDPDQVGVLVADVEREPIHWLWPGRLALGKLTIVDGDPGLGKSTLLYDLAARLTTGRPMPDGVPSEPGGVLILSTEDGLADTIRPRLEAAGADLHRCLVVQIIPEPGGPGRVPLLPDDLPLLEHAARRVDARLLIIDPLMAHLGSETNTYRDQDVRRMLAAVSALAERCALAVAVVRHLNKTSGGNALYRGGGSIGIIGAARVGLLVGRDPEDGERLVLACTKNNLARLPASLAFRVVPAPSDPATSQIAWEGVCTLQAQDLLSSPGGGTNTATDEAAKWLEDILAEGPRPAAEVYTAAEAAGIKKHALQRARGRVAASERQGGISGQGYWQWRLRETKVTPKMTKITSSETCNLSDLSHLSGREGASRSEEQAAVSPKMTKMTPCDLSNLSGESPSGDGDVRPATDSKSAKTPISPKIAKMTSPETCNLSHLRGPEGESGAEEAMADFTKMTKMTPCDLSNLSGESPSGDGDARPATDGERLQTTVSPKMTKIASPGRCHLSDLSDLSRPADQHFSTHPGSGLCTGQWVDTPAGPGRVLQVFAHRVTVHVCEQAVSFPPEQITVLPPPTPP